MQERLLDSASVFLEQVHLELGIPGLNERIMEVREEVAQYGTYRHLPHELEHGARMAWRNSNRCIGRLYWKSLMVRDCRHLLNREDVVNALFDHLDSATNGGRILPMITVFAQRKPDGKDPVRIWNKNLIRYACHPQDDGTVVGDPAQKEFTGLCESMGWQGRGGAFDILPMVVQTEGKPVWHPIPSEKVLEVELEHPQHPWLKELQLR